MKTEKIITEFKNIRIVRITGHHDNENIKSLEEEGYKYFDRAQNEDHLILIFVK